MRLTQIAVNNLQRRKGKVAFLLSGLIIGVATIVSMVSITTALNADLQDKIDQFGANMVVAPKSGSLALDYGGVQVSSTAFDVRDLKEEDAAKILTIPNKANIAAVAPKLIGATEINGTRALMVGIDFESELRLKKWWKISGNEPKDAGDILVGSNIASKLNLSPGNSVRLKNEEFRVAGILTETGSQEDSVFFVQLPVAQRLLDKPGALSLIEVAALCRACPIEEIIVQVKDVIPDVRVSALRKAVVAREETVNQLTSFTAAISIAVLFIGALIVLTTMMSSVNERTREIGIFRATGFRKSHIMKIIFTESLILSLIGGFAGWLIGMLASFTLGPSIANISVSVIQLDPVVAGSAIILSIIVGFLGAFYPAIKASNLDPADALRFA